MCGICITISLSLASLTLVLAVRSAPRSNKRPQMAVWPFLAAKCSAVWSVYHNRETETERDRSGQGHTAQEKRRQETGAARGTHRGTETGQGIVDQDKVRVA